MKIIFSTDQIYLHGGIEKVLAIKANYFADILNYEVVILTTEQYGKKSCYPLSSKVKIVDIAVNYNRGKSYFHPSNILKIPSHFLKWYKKIKSIKPDIIISCNYAYDFYWFPFFFRSVPKLKEFHSSRHFEFIAYNQAKGLAKLKFIINDFVESKFTQLVVLNPDEVKYYKSNNVIVIPNPTNTKTDQKASLKNKRVIAAGRLAPVKRFDHLIDIWSLVVEQEPEWVLYIFGDGLPDYKQKLTLKIKENNLENNVIIQNATNDLISEMLNSSIYLMTSQTECYPMVLIEALTVGLPVVSYDCPTGPCNIITQDFDGILVENQNIDAITEKILFLIRESQFRISLGDNAFSNSKKFTIENVMQKWESLLIKLISYKN